LTKEVVAVESDLVDLDESDLRASLMLGCIAGIRARGPVGRGFFRPRRFQGKLSRSGR
jgi:hypothetical protein